MTPTRMLPRALLALALLAPATAHAEPPEGCVGFPDIPEAFVCVTQWTPENAVPTVTPGPDQTVVIPEFCVFQCFGPTPVNVPSFVVTQGNGVIAVIQYDGQTYTVAVPPVPDLNALVQQVVSTVTGLVQTVLGVAGQAVTTVEGIVAQAGRTQGTFTASAQVSCFGCGPSPGSLDGTFTGSINGHPYTGAWMQASFTADAPSGANCALTSTAAGVMWIGSDSASFAWTQVGPTVLITFSGGFTATAVAAFMGSGVTCGAPAVFSLAGVLAGT